MRRQDHDMEDASEVFVGAFTAALGLVGLVLASGALDDEIYLFGFALAGFGVAFNIMLIKRQCDRRDAIRAAARPPVRHD
jgi:hypothetical protein